jgi:diguanylate cyclase (GGDEF)-like protein
LEAKLSSILSLVSEVTFTPPFSDIQIDNLKGNQYQGALQSSTPNVLVNQTDDNPSVERLIKNITPILESKLCLEVLELFQNIQTIFAIPVVNQFNIPVGIVERSALIEIFIKPYTKELYAKKPISEFMNKTPLVVDKDTAIDDIAKIIIDAGMRHMVNGFIATDNNEYLGIANGHDLLNEMTERKQAHLFKLAHFDQLTNLPNRNLFHDRLKTAILQSGRQNIQVGLLFIDLDNFKHFNDSMGHSFGDKILLAVATRLYGCARECDTVARLAGDEFTIVVEQLNDKDALDKLCCRIQEVMKEPLQVMGKEVFATLSIGTAVYPNDDDNPAGLMVKADAAMYEAKRNGRNTYRHYAEGMSLYSYDHMSLETDLRRALESSEFDLFYQPQINLKNGMVVGCEALIRWKHPKRGLLTPIHFIETLESTGLIITVGNWILRLACIQHMQWIKYGLAPIKMAVNISPLQFIQPDFCKTVSEIIEETGIQPSNLEFELTESLCMNDVKSVLRTLQELKNIGVTLAIDDFGTGFSNLSYLKKFPIDRLKIDQSFIRNIEREPVNVGIVTAIVALGKSLNLELIAEGVETESEMNVVNSCGCELVQGYLFSKPIPADSFVSLVINHNKIKS